MNNRKLVYTTLKGLISKTEQFNFNNFVNCRMNHKNKRYVNIKLTPELTEEIKILFKDFLRLENIKTYESFGIYDRLIIDKNGLVSYIAGQDYPGEVRYLKKLLRC